VLLKLNIWSLLVVLAVVEMLVVGVVQVDLEQALDLQ
jgi:hypothetical protein